MTKLESWKNNSESPMLGMEGGVVDSEGSRRDILVVTVKFCILSLVSVTLIEGWSNDIELCIYALYQRQFCGSACATHSATTRGTCLKGTRVFSVALCTVLVPSSESIITSK